MNSSDPILSLSVFDILLNIQQKRPFFLLRRPPILELRQPIHRRLFFFLLAALPAALSRKRAINKEKFTTKKKLRKHSTALAKDGWQIDAENLVLSTFSFLLLTEALR